MAQARIIYDLADAADRYLYDLANESQQMASVLHGLDEYLRGEIKYQDLTEDAYQAITRVREELHEQLVASGLDLGRLIR